jgi:beta-N-acetylhexosaminidase
MPHQLISRRVLATGTAGAVALCVAAVGAVPASATPEPAGRAGAAAGPERSVAAALRLMSTQEKVGQLFTQNVYGSDATTPDPRNLPLYGVASPAEVVRKYHLGGVIYFAWTDSVKDPAQIAALSNGLQRAAIGSGAHIPLTVGTDQEQGVVTRIGPPATQFPGSMALGASRSTADARTAAAITGRELKAMGINVDYAPDADVNVNPLNPVIGTRSFSSDPSLVSSRVSAQVTGYQKDAGIVATPKHFPGHGDTATDSHTGIPVITHTREQWLRTDAPPFKAAISAGADMIMSGHLVVPALDPSGDPATLSKPILTGILRQELGFKGVITTDSLAMQGVRDKYGDGEVAVRAVLAGADSLMMAPDMDAAYGSVLSAVQSGRISRHRLDESVARILLLKLRRGILTHPYTDASRLDQVVGTPEHLAAAATASAIAASLGAAPVSRRVTVEPRRVRAPARVAVVVAPYPVTRTLLPGARSGRVASSLRRTVVVRFVMASAAARCSGVPTTRSRREASV